MAAWMAARTAALMAVQKAYSTAAHWVFESVALMAAWTGPKMAASSAVVMARK